MKEPEVITTEKDTRRKLLFGISLLSLFPLLKFGSLFAKKSNVISCAPDEQKHTVKMLTQDGKLVEVEVSNIKGAEKQKISNKDLMAWVKK